MGVNLSSASLCLFALGESLDLSHASVSPSACGAVETLQCWAALQFAMVDTGTEIKGGSCLRCPCCTAEQAHLRSAAFCCSSLTARGCGQVLGLF